MISGFGLPSPLQDRVTVSPLTASRRPLAGAFLIVGLAGKRRKNEVSIKFIKP